MKMTSGCALFAAVQMLKIVRAGGAASGQGGASLFLARTAWKSTERLVRSFISRYMDNTWILALSLNHQSWNLTIIRAFLCDILPINQFLQQMFWPNIVPSFGTGPPHIYKGFTKGKIQKIHYGP